MARLPAGRGACQAGVRHSRESHSAPSLWSWCGLKIRLLQRAALYRRPPESRGTVGVVASIRTSELPPIACSRTS